MIAVSIISMFIAAPPSASNGEARRVMSGFISCIINREAYKIRPLLDHPVGEAPTPNWAALADAGCLEYSGSLKFASMLMRGGIYNALYKEDFGKAEPVVNFEDVPRITYPFASSDSPNSKEADTYRLEMVLGDCIARAQPQESRSLVLSDVESPQEQSAVQALLPAISSCLPKGQTLTMNKSTIRGFVAEALYRLTVAKRNLSHAQG